MILTKNFPLQFFILLLVILSLEIAAGVLGYKNRDKVCFTQETLCFIGSK